MSSSHRKKKSTSTSILQDSDGSDAHGGFDSYQETIQKSRASSTHFNCSNRDAPANEMYHQGSDDEGIVSRRRFSRSEGKDQSHGLHNQNSFEDSKVSDRVWASGVGGLTAKEKSHGMSRERPSLTNEGNRTLSDPPRFLSRGDIKRGVGGYALSVGDFSQDGEKISSDPPSLFSGSMIGDGDWKNSDIKKAGFQQEGSGRRNRESPNFSAEGHARGDDGRGKGKSGVSKEERVS